MIILANIFFSLAFVYFPFVFYLAPYYEYVASLMIICNIRQWSQFMG